MKPEITELELLLDKINLLFNQMKADGNMDKIEAELFLKYIHQLAGRVEQIKVDNSVQPIVVKEEMPPEKTITDPPVLIETKEPEIKPVEIKEEEKIKVAPEVNIKAFEKLQPEIEALQKTESKQTEKKIQKKSLIKAEDHDSDEDEKFGLHGKLSKEKKTLADKINNKKYGDLRTSIDLNERIYFIRRLFKGDQQSYDKAIAHLNSITSANEAANYIESVLRAQFEWQDDEAVKQFEEAVQQKFK